MTFVILFTGVCSNIMWHSAKCQCFSHAFLVLCNLCSWCSIVSVDLLQIARIFTPISTTNCPFVGDKLLSHTGNCMCTSTDDINVGEKCNVCRPCDMGWSQTDTCSLYCRLVVAASVWPQGIHFNVITFIASLLRGTTQGNMTSQRERTVAEMTHAQPWLPSPTADPHSRDCYMNTSYSMHNTQSRLPVNDNDVITLGATIGTFETVVFFNAVCTTIV